MTDSHVDNMLTIQQELTDVRDIVFRLRERVEIAVSEALLAEASVGSGEASGEAVADDQVPGGKSASAYLHELVQQDDGDIPSYAQTFEQEGPPHARVFTCVIVVEGGETFTSSASTKKEARQVCAKQVLRRYNKLV